jgi:hypothetical protein
VRYRRGPSGATWLSRERGWIPGSWWRMKSGRVWFFHKGRRPEARKRGDFQRFGGFSRGFARGFCGGRCC